MESKNWKEVAMECMAGLVVMEKKYDIIQKRLKITLAKARTRCTRIRTLERRLNNEHHEADHLLHVRQLQGKIASLTSKCDSKIRIVEELKIALSRKTTDTKVKEFMERIKDYRCREKRHLDEITNLKNGLMDSISNTRTGCIGETRKPSDMKVEDIPSSRKIHVGHGEETKEK